jgi:hypothetical protein
LNSLDDGQKLGGDRGNLPGVADKGRATVQQPVPVDVTGKVQAEVVGKVDTSVLIQVEGLGRVVGMSTTSSGNAQGNVGASMPHIKAGPR